MELKKTYLKYERKVDYLDDYYIKVKQGEEITTKMDENKSNYIRMDNLYTLQLWQTHNIYIVKPLGSICKKSYGSFYDTAFYTESIEIITQYDIETFVNTVPRKVQKILLERNGWILPLIKGWTRKMAKIALSNSPSTLLKLKEPDKKLIKIALKNRPTLSLQMEGAWIEYGIEVLKKWMEKDKKNAKYFITTLNLLNTKL
jgi:hypothetical protein